MRANARFSNELRYRDGKHPEQTHLTPAYVLKRVREDLGRTYAGISPIDLDPCTTADNPTRAHRFYTAEDDGLKQPWALPTIYSIFVNPPYGKAREPWVERCVLAGQRQQRVILLIPAATDTEAWQWAASTAMAVVFVRGRVKFGTLRPNRRQEAASHPSSLIGWNTPLKSCASLGLRLASVCAAAKEAT